MIYPKFIKSGDKVGITAPSDGIAEDIDIKRLNNAIEKFNELGFEIVETESVRKSQKGRSNTKEARANELMSLYKNDEVSCIICASGGDFLMEILNLVDYDLIKKNPKWIQGYSDPTGLTYLITTTLDIATIYGNNVKAFGMKEWHKSLSDNIKLLKGDMIQQTSFEKYEKERVDNVTGDEGYNLTGEVYWKNVLDGDDVNFTGRIIGGCLELIDLHFGRKYDKTLEFIEKYKDDGIIWYFDIFDKRIEDVMLSLTRFKEEGYFKYTKGFIFGRMIQEKSYCDYTYEEGMLEVLKDLNVPIIINADVGHVSPRIAIINGAIATVESKDGKGSITFELR